MLLYLAMSIVERLKQHVKRAIRDCLPEDVSTRVVIGACRNSDYGDFHCDIAVKLAQGQRTIAVDLAYKIANALASSNCADDFVVSVGPAGLLNFRLTTKCLTQSLLELHQQFTEESEFSRYRDSLAVDCFQQCSSIINCAIQPGFDLLNEKMTEPLLSDLQWQNCKLQYKTSASAFCAAFDDDPLLFGHQKSLILMLERAVSSQSVSSSRDVAHAFSRFYQHSRVLSDQIDIARARLGLVLAVKLVLGR